MPSAYLGLGSNIGDRYAFIKKAIVKIKSNKRIKVIHCSSIFETEPWGLKEQREFLNCVIKIETDIPPVELVNEMKEIETKLGRKKKEMWGEREIDIDVLFYDDIVYSDEEISIPHMELHNRRFVLVPMCEIAPDYVHPAFDMRIIELLDITPDKSVVKIYKNTGRRVNK
jgi:2-amino-4-hydroxy-6-hydroxymethyldihydropteridine diphosphokinase